MPAQHASASIVQKLGNTLLQAHEAIKGNTTVPQVQMELPAGINNGIAEIRSCKFMQIAEGKNNAGEWQFYTSAIVKMPKVHNGIPVEGKRTFTIEPIYATPSRERKTIQDHMDHIYGLWRLWGVSPQAIAAIDLRKDPQALEKMCAQIEKAGIYIAFRTWAGQKQVLGQGGDGKWYLFNNGENTPIKGKGPYTNEAAAKTANPYAGREPMTNHSWGERIVFMDTAVNGQSHVVDNTAAPTAAPFDEFAPSTTSTPSTDELSEDVNVLAEAAEDNNAARNRLKQMALDAGITEEAIKVAESWQAVAGMIQASVNGTLAGAEGEGIEDEPWKPEAGKVYGYEATVTNLRTKKKEKKAVQVEVKVVHEEQKTAEAMNISDRKTTYKAIPWDELLLLEE